MSAWLVSKNHVRTLVQAGLLYGLVEPEDADRLATDLYQECAKSVTYRYQHLDDIDFERAAQTDTVTYRPVTPVTDNPAPFWVKQIRCYWYQSCEHPGWDSSAARAWVDQLEATILERAPEEQFQPCGGWMVGDCHREKHPLRYASHLKGYEDAPWGFGGDDAEEDAAA